MSGAMLLLPLYAFIAWTGRIVPFLTTVVGLYMFYMFSNGYKDGYIYYRKY
jgi:hypothetical protein